MSRAQGAASHLLHALLWIGVTLWLAGCGGGAGTTDHVEPVPIPDFSAEVKAVLQKKIQLIQQLAAQPVIVGAVQAANEENADRTQAEVEELDRQWQQGDGLDGFVKPLLTNECAQLLLDFQETHDGFPELFVTDQRGLIVAATNKTSDYFQADEPWWVEVYDAGRGKSHLGRIEYDESAMSEAISLYVPVMAPETKRAIGAIKAVCDITAVKMEL